MLLSDRPQTENRRGSWLGSVWFAFAVLASSCGGGTSTADADTDDDTDVGVDVVDDAGADTEATEDVAPACIPELSFESCVEGLTYDHDGDPTTTCRPVTRLGGGYGGCFVNGDGTVGCRGTTMPPTEVLDDAIAVGQGSPTNWGGACALRRGGQVLCWDALGATLPGPEAVAGAVQFGVWSGGGCVLDRAGQLRCWDAQFAWRALPELVSATALVDFVGSGENGCGVTANHEVLCWGNPGLAVPPGGLEPVSQLLPTHYDGACAVTVDGGVICWAEPPYMEAWVTELPTEELAGVVQIAWGTYEDWVADRWPDIEVEILCALDAAGAVACWRLRRGVPEPMAVPPGLEPAVQLTWFDQALSFCAVDVYGQVTCWRNTAAGLADTSPHPLGPVRSICASRGKAYPEQSDFVCAVSDAGYLACWSSDSAPVPPGLSGVEAVLCGGHFACSLTTAGAVDCWSRYDDYDWGPPDSLGPVVQLSAGARHACAVDAAGAVTCWGSRPEDAIAVPSDLGPVTQVAASTMILPVHAYNCAVLVTGAVRCWGSVGAAPAYAVPTDLSDAVQVSAGRQAACAVTTGGAVRCWGECATVPASLGAKSVVAVGAGGYEDVACALTQDGEVTCWDCEGAVRAVPEGLGHIVALSVGDYMTCVLDDVGESTCWTSRPGFDRMVTLPSLPRLAPVPCQEQSAP